MAQETIGIVPKPMEKYSVDMELTVGDGFAAEVR